MTELAAPAWMQTRRDAPVEHWHAMVLNGGFLASVIVVESREGHWMARSQLRDRALRPVSEARGCGPFATHEAACQAGEAEASRLHRAVVGTREESSTASAWIEPPGGYQSQALRRCVHAQKRAQTRRMAASAGQGEIEAEKIA